MDPEQVAYYQEPIKWFKLAAQQGHGYAQNALGTMFMSGYGVPADFVIAHMRSSIAAANGNEIGAKNGEIIAQQMTPEDISGAWAMAGVCMNSNYEKCGYLPQS